VFTAPVSDCDVEEEEFVFVFVGEFSGCSGLTFDEGISKFSRHQLVDFLASANPLETSFFLNGERSGFTGVGVERLSASGWAFLLEFVVHFSRQRAFGEGSIGGETFLEKTLL
jgi:hypothetical protein